MKPTILIDANNLVFRAHFGHRELKTEDGRPTSVLFGFTSMLLDVWKAIGSTDTIVVWDRAVPGFEPMVSLPEKIDLWRKTLAPETYKANRVPNPDIIFALKQLPALSKMLRHMGVPQIACPTLEADDLIGLLCERLRKERQVSQVLIYSTDRDMYQLVDGKKVCVLAPSKGPAEIMDWEKVRVRAGVPPELYAAMKAMAGDPSDNIMGLKGVGPKTATTYLMDGLDPAVPLFSSLPSGVRKKYAHFEDQWSYIHRCYELTYIPRTTEFKYFCEVVQRELPRVLDIAVKKRCRPIRRDRVAIKQRRLLSLFADYELNYFLSKRNEFFRDVTLID